MDYVECRLCPRECRVDRRVKTGFCGQSDRIKIARYQKHLWEEPCISGTRGCGTVFFSGCTLRCIYCQNFDVSRGMGEEITEDRLTEIFFELQDMGCHNISIVTGTHFIPGIKRALDKMGAGLKVPVVFNCGGYESVESMKSLENYVDVYIPDVKYKSSELSSRYSSCRDYYDRTMEAVAEMLRQAPEAQFDSEGIMQKGVIIRHLVLPGGYKDSIEVLEGIYENFGNKGFLLSLMSQYTPMPSCKAVPEINRPITTFEYRKVQEKALELGFDGYFQGKDSSNKAYIPPFGKDDIRLG